MTYSLGIQSAYTHIEAGIFADGRLLISAQKDKTLASKELAPLCAWLLAQVDKKITDLSYIAVNQGPAPFTTLRTVITTANGLAFATNIPLVGVDGLAAFLQESQQTITNRDVAPVILLHAFSNDVYYAYENSGTPVYGCAPFATVLEQLKMLPAQHLHFFGNGTVLHAVALKEALGKKAIIQEPLALYGSLTHLGNCAWQSWQRGQTATQLQPLYLKKTL